MVIQNILSAFIKTFGSDIKITLKKYRECNLADSKSEVKYSEFPKISPVYKGLSMIAQLLIVRNF